MISYVGDVFWSRVVVLWGVLFVCFRYDAARVQPGYDATPGAADDAAAAAVPAAAGAAATPASSTSRHHGKAHSQQVLWVSNGHLNP